jgi:dienelactone hydrolase
MLLTILIAGPFALLGMLYLVPRMLPTACAQLPGGKPPAEETPAHGYVITKAVKGSEIPADYTFVLTRDEIYVPIAVRKPKDNGRFPVITMGFGEGKRGMLKVEELVERLAPMQDRMIARGYVVATVNYRNEVPYLYEQIQEPAQNLPDSISGERRTLKSHPTLDHEDLIASMRYLQTQPYVEKNAIGAMGVSHSGEMILKAAAEYDFAAGVCIEPAAHEFLSVNTGPSAPRKGTEIQYNDIAVVRKNSHKAAATDRIRRIKTPFLIFGRDTDHLNGIFKLTNEWMREAGKDVTWYSFDHPEHGYVFIYPAANGSYKPDNIQEKTFEIFMAYFDKHLKRASTQ